MRLFALFDITMRVKDSLSPRHWSAPRRTAHAARNKDKEPAGSVSGEPRLHRLKQLTGRLAIRRDTDSNAARSRWTGC
jgi:hypothetical protein